MIYFCDFIQVYVFSTNHHLNGDCLVAPVAQWVKRWPADQLVSG